jgi:hypothetical protein
MPLRLARPLLVLAAVLDACVARAGVALVRRIDTWNGSGLGIANPSGITYVPSTRSFWITDERAGRGAEDAWEVDLAGPRVLRALDLTPASYEASDLVYHAGRGTFFLADDDALRIVEVDPEGRAVASTDLGELGGHDPEGIACDAARDRLFVADGHGEQVLELTGAGARLGSFSLKDFGFDNAEGIAYDAASDHLFLVSDDDGGVLFELTRDGRLVQAHGLLELGAVRPRGLALGPSSDPGDPPGTTNLYVADERTKGEPDGAILELARVARPPGAQVRVSLLGDVDGFGFASDAAGFAAGDLDHDGVLEPGERLPGTLRTPPAFDLRTPEDPRATDALLVVSEDAPLRFAHSVELGGRPALWARLTLVAADARALPGARNLVRADGRLVGELVGTREDELHAGHIEATVLELAPALLRELADGVLQVEIARAPGTGSDDVMVDYSRLEVAVAR